MRFFAWLFLASLSLVLMVQLQLIDAPLRSPDTPFGIVGFELAFTAARSSQMLAMWRSMDVLESARVSLGVDVAFLLVYPFMLRSLVLLLRGSAGMGRAVLACIPLDAIENLALWRQVESGSSGGLALVAGVTASFKFLLVFATVAWCVGTLFRRLFHRPAHG